MSALGSTVRSLMDLSTSLEIGLFNGRLSEREWPGTLTSWGLVPTLGFITSVLLARLIAGWVYNLYFHPLAWAPGPVLGRASLFYRFLHTNRGRFHLVVTEAHRKYGPIVRVAPNELSFASNEAWKAIYGHPSMGKEIAPKGPFYDAFAAGFDSKCIGSERHPPAHSRMRKMLNPAFSQRALLAQEKIIGDVIDRFVKIVGEKAPGGSPGLNMSKWYEINSFDILGEMAFGESFHGLESGKPHFWADIVLEHLYFINLVDNLRRVGWIARCFGCLVPASLIRRNQNSQYSRRQVEKLLASGHSREDFVSTLVEKVRAGEISREEMAAHVSTITIAGGETVATTLTSLTCFLGQNPDKLGRVVSEIRQAFDTYESISAQEAQRLPYLQAVINEGLRLFPPASGGAPRVSPGFELHGAFIPKGTEVNVNPWAVTHDEKYFHAPYAFLPERWIDPKSTDLKEASRPFLLGPRDCLGRNFAMMELNLVLAKMLWTYDIELVNREIDWLREGKVFVLWWKPKLFVRFHKRAGKDAVLY